VSGKCTAQERFPEVIAAAEMVGEARTFVAEQVPSC
jgi:hypothetical protein